MPTNRRRSLAAALSASLLTASLGVALLPIARDLANGPVDVRSGEVTTAVDGEQLVRLPIAASHVTLHWDGSPDALIRLSLGRSERTLGAAIEVRADDDAAPGEVTYTDVIWADGARVARVSADRPISRLTVVAIDADASRTIDDTAVANAATNQPTIIRRSGWGANEAYRHNGGGYVRWAPSFEPIQKIIVHHTAGANNDPNPAATIRAIYYNHAVVRGWGDIDYNFLIDAQGRVYEGRWSRPYPAGESPTGEDLAGNVVRGAHARHFNDATVGIALLGNFSTVLPTSAARTSLINLLAWKAERHGLDPKGASTYVNPADGTTKWLYNISGHRNVGVTACPGQRFYDTFPALRQAVADRIASTTGPTVDHAAPSVISLKPMVPSPTGAVTIPFGLIFREPVVGLGVGDFTVDGSNDWSVTSITGKGSTYQVNVARDAGSSPPDGPVSLTLKAGTVTDLAAHAGPTTPVAAIANFATDTSPPTAVLWSNPPANPTRAVEFGVSVLFNEPVLGLTSADIEVSGSSQAGSPWNVQQVFGTGNMYNFTIDHEASTPASGTLAFRIRAGGATDLAGNPNVDTNTITYDIDASRPVVTAPATRLLSGVTLSGSSLRARASWSGSDVGPAGIASYDLARSIDGAAFRTISSGLGSPTAPLLLGNGHTYRFETLARDRVGNTSAWAMGPSFRASLYQQYGSSVRYSGPYGTVSSTSYSGGSTRYMTRAGAYASFTTTARSLAFVTTRGPSRGAVKIYVDGVYQGTVDLYAASTSFRYVAFAKTWSSAATHTIKVVVVGTAGRPRVDIDAFGMLR